MGNLADYNINEVAGSAALWGCYDCQRTVADIEEGKKDDESDKTTGTPTTTPTATPTASATVPSLSITNP